MFDPATGNYTSLADTGYTRTQIVEWFNALSARTGASVEPSDIDQLIAKLMGEARFIPQDGGNPQLAFDIYETQYMIRGDKIPDIRTGTPLPAVNVPTPTAAPVYQTSVASAAAGGPSALTGATYTPAGLMTPQTGGGGYPFAPPSVVGFLGLDWMTWGLIAAAGLTAWYFWKR